MEHNPLMELSDETAITFSDLKTKANGEQFITIYFETPSERYGFCSMDIEFPDGTPKNVVGYTPEDIKRLLYHYKKVADIALRNAIEEAAGERVYA